MLNKKRRLSSLISFFLSHSTPEQLGQRDQQPRPLPVRLVPGVPPFAPPRLGLGLLQRNARDEEQQKGDEDGAQHGEPRRRPRPEAGHAEQPQPGLQDDLAEVVWVPCQGPEPLVDEPAPVGRGETKLQLLSVGDGLDDKADGEQEGPDYVCGPEPAPAPARRAVEPQRPGRRGEDPQSLHHPIDKEQQRLLQGLLEPRVSAELDDAEE